MKPALALYGGPAAREARVDWASGFAENLPNNVCPYHADKTKPLRLTESKEGVFILPLLTGLIDTHYL